MAKKKQLKKGYIEIEADAQGQALLEPMVVHEGLWTEGKKYRELLDAESVAKKARENQKSKLLPIIRENMDEFDDDANNLEKKIWSKGGVKLAYIDKTAETLTVSFVDAGKPKQPQLKGDDPTEVY